MAGILRDPYSLLSYAVWLRDIGYGFLCSDFVFSHKNTFATLSFLGVPSRCLAVSPAMSPGSHLHFNGICQAPEFAWNPGGTRPLKPGLFFPSPEFQPCLSAGNLQLGGKCVDSIEAAQA